MTRPRLVRNRKRESASAAKNPKIAASATVVTVTISEAPRAGRNSIVPAGSVMTFTKLRSVG